MTSPQPKVGGFFYAIISGGAGYIPIQNCIVVKTRLLLLSIAVCCFSFTSSAQLKWEWGHGVGIYQSFDVEVAPLPNVSVELSPTWQTQHALSVRVTPFLLQTSFGLVAEQIASYRVEDCNCSMDIQFPDAWRFTQQVFWLPRPDTVTVQPLLGVGVAMSRMSVAFPRVVTQSFATTADGPATLSFNTTSKSRYLSWQALTGIDVKVSSLLGMRVLVGAEQHIQQAATRLPSGYQSLNRTFYFDVERPAWYWFGQLSLYLRFT